MSFTFTKEGKELNFLLNNDNWGILFEMLNLFRYMRNFDLDSLQWLNLYSDMKEDFLKDLYLHNQEVSRKVLFQWFLRFLGTYEEIKITDIELHRLKKISEVTNDD